MKKAFVLLALSLAMLPSLAASRVIMYGGYQIGDPNSDVMTDETRIPGLPSYVYDSGQQSSKALSASQIPGQKIVQWWAYSSAQNVPATQTTPAHIQYNNRQTIANSTYSFDWTYSTVDYSPVYVVVDYDYIEYNLSYNANGGSFTPSTVYSIVYTNGVGIASGDGVTRVGYTWSGWTNNYTTTVWTGGEMVTGASLGLNAINDGVDVVLSAKWTPHTYTVNFNKNTSGSVSGDMAAMELTYGVAANLTPNAFVRNGYNFTGWTTINGGESPTYGDGAQVLNLTSDDKGEVNLYAVWAAKKYSITYHANDGTGDEWEQTGGAYGTQIEISSMEKERIGYQFGWWTDATGTTTYEAGKKYLIDPGDADVIHLYAVWTPIKYKIGFDANGGEGDMGEVDVDYDAEFLLPDCTFTKALVEFKGWTTNIAADAELFVMGDAVSNLVTTAGEKVTFYAVWTEPRYIAFDGNGADNPDEMADDMMKFEGVETKALVPNEFEKTGYTFDGWATNATTAVTPAYTNCEEVISTNLWKAIGETNDLYAVWQANKYTVFFNPNGGTGSMDDQKFVYDQVQNLSKLIDGPIGSTLGFLGWATNNTGVAVFGDGDPVSNLTAVADGVIMLYAVWNNGDLSKAMHCDNLLWVDSASGDWTTCIGAEEGYNASGSSVCAIVPGDQTRSRVLKISQETTGAGKLSFMYKMSSQDVSLCWLSCKTNSSSPRVIIEPKTTWTQFGPIDIEDIRDVDLTFSLGEFTSDSDEYIVWIDQMKWEPEGEDQKPSVYTNTVPSAVTGLVYDGKAKTGVIAGYGHTVGYTISGNVATNAGDYVATATPDAYCVWPDGSSDPTNIQWSIAKAEYDMHGVSFIDATFVVDGEAHSIYVSGDLPDGVAVSYSGNDATTPGTYIVTASFTGDAINYEPIADMTATMTIVERTVPVPIAVEGLVYNGAEQMGVTSGVDYVLSGNVATNAGEYVATAMLDIYCVWPDGSSDPTNIHWSIAKATYDMSGVTFTNATYTADGEAHSIYVSGDLPDGVEVSYSGNDKTESGTYTVTASFTGDAVNYEPIADMTATMTIIRGAGPNPDTTDLVLHPAGEPSLDAFTAAKAETYVGWLRDGSGSIAAQITVKTSAAKSGKAAKSTITVIPVGGKKYTLKTTVLPGGNPTDEFGITYGELGLAGTLKGFAVEASADVAKSKDASVKALAGKIPVGTYTFVVETGDGTAVFSAAVDKKGKARVQGFLGNGTKVSVSATGSLGDTYFAVPVVVSKSKVSFGFVLWIPLAGGSPVFVGAIGSSWQALRAGGAIALSNGVHAFDFEMPSFRSYIAAVGSTPAAPVGEEFTVSGSKWVFAKTVGKLKVVDGVLSVASKGEPSNLSGLKLTYTAKTGLVKGSFKLYYMDGGKIKSDKVTIVGAVAEGVFMGNGTVKKLGSFAVWAE